MTYCKTCKIHIHPHNKQRHERSQKHLKASGFFGDLANKGLDFVNNLTKKFIKNGYNNQSTKTINDFGNWKIMKINIYRRPIEGMLETALQLITAGNFEDGKKAGGYEAFYHLGLFCVLNNQLGGWANIIVEKNEIIHVEKVSYNLEKWTTSDNILPVFVRKQLTLNDLLNNAQKVLGDQYFFYDPWKNNCQVFCRALLSGSGLLTTENDKFVFQPLEEVIKKIPSVSQKLALTTTNLGGLFNNLLGKGAPKRKPRRKGGNMTDEQVLADLDDTDSKYLQSDKKRHENWLSSIEERNQKQSENNYMKNALKTSEQKKKEADELKQLQIKMATDPKFRNIYLKQLHERQNEFAKSEQQRLQEDENRINEIRDIEYLEKQKAERDADPFNMLTDIFNETLSMLPAGKLLSTGTKALTSALRGGNRKRKSKKRVSFRK